MDTETDRWKFVQQLCSVASRDKWKRMNEMKWMIAYILFMRKKKDAKVYSKILFVVSMKKNEWIVHIKANPGIIEKGWRKYMKAT